MKFEEVRTEYVVELEIKETVPEVTLTVSSDDVLARAVVVDGVAVMVQEPSPAPVTVIDALPFAMTTLEIVAASAFVPVTDQTMDSVVSTGKYVVDAVMVEPSATVLADKLGVPNDVMTISVTVKALDALARAVVVDGVAVIVHEPALTPVTVTDAVPSAMTALEIVAASAFVPVTDQVMDSVVSVGAYVVDAVMVDPMATVLADKIGVPNDVMATTLAVET